MCVCVCDIYAYSGSSLMCRLPLVSMSRGTLSSCGMWASHCGGPSCCGAQALGHVGFRAGVHRLSPSAACRISPCLGPNLFPLHWQVSSQPLGHQGSPSESLLWPQRHLRRKRLSASSSHKQSMCRSTRTLASLACPLGSNEKEVIFSLSPCLWLFLGQERDTGFRF